MNLYNTPITLHVGANDAAYDRNKAALRWDQWLNDLQEQEPGGYLHWTQIYPDKGHWIDGGAAEALPWMARHTRDPLPKKIIWRQDRHRRFYWLAADRLQPGAVVRATVSGRQIDIGPGGVDHLVIRANDRLLDLDGDITIQSGGKTLLYGRMIRTIAVLARTLEERGDPASVFSAEVVVVFDKAQQPG